MEVEGARTWWFVGLIAVTIAVSVSLASSARRYDPALASAAATACVVAAAAVAGLAWWRYRESRDPHALFVAAGFAVIAVQGAIFGVWWPLAHTARSAPADFGTRLPRALGAFLGVGSGAAPAFAWQIGWVVAGSLFLLALPWRDRRGRPAVRAGSVVGLTALGVALTDLLVTALYRTPSDGGLICCGPVIRRSSLGALGWILAVAAVACLTGASFREWHAKRGTRASHTWLSVAFILAVPLQVAGVLHPTVGSPFVQWADALQPIVPALAFVSFLVEQRSEASRMRRATDRADEVMGGRAEIAAMVAHEVRGPVATVRGMAGTTLAHYDRLTDAERREFLQMIETESRRLLATVDQTSLALKVDAGTLTYDKRLNDLAGIVRAGLEAADVEDHDVRVSIEEGASVVCDRTRITEVVRQLVDNAAKFSPAGTPITVNVGRAGDEVVIEVIDGGPGIPRDQREAVFEKFPSWRPSGYQEQPGSGLGLFISKGLVTEHSGEISVGDGPTGGTMLQVRLPVEG